MVVTSSDVINATKANSKLCALSRAAMRLPGVNAAYFFRSTAFVEYGDEMVKYQLPPSVQKEIVSFDRAKIFAPGVYQLAAVSPSNSKKAIEERSRSRKSIKPSFT